MIDDDPDVLYRAYCARDARFDGRFFVGVRSTGIFCRPICPAKTPRQENCVFLPGPAAAVAAGFRPCLRCRPEAAPGLPAAAGTAATVARALRLIAEGGLNDAGVEDLAARLGVGARHLRRLFERHLGAAPVQVAQVQRVLFAKSLITDTSLPMTEIALAAGFGSLRRFNDALRQTYGMPPSALRRTTQEPGSAVVTLSLAYRPPYDWDALLGFLGRRAIPGVERIEAGAYARTFTLPGGARGVLRVRRDAERRRLIADVSGDRAHDLAAVAARLRGLFDLDADIDAVAAHLSADPLLAPLVARRPGLRVPGAWEPFELAVRAILGQRISVSAAVTLAGRLTERFGMPLEGAPAPALSRLFPTAEALATADLSGLGLPQTRARALQALAAAVAADPALLTASGDPETTAARLQDLPGIGPWTAQYIVMRALRAPDAFPGGDLGLVRAFAPTDPPPSPRAAAALLDARAEAWRPWRAYAALHLWMKDALDDPSPAVVHAES